MKKLILGSSGFIGSHTRYAFRNLKIPTINFDVQNPQKIYSTKEEWHIQNINNPNIFNNIDFTQVDRVINTGDYFDFTNIPNEKQDEYLLGLQNLILHMPKHIPITHISSISALDANNKITNNSNYSTLQLPYIKHKIATDKIFENNLCTTLYLGGVYSNHCELYLLYQIIKRIFHKPFDINFTTVKLNNNIIPFVHIDDVVNSITSSYLEPGKYIIAQDKPVSYINLHTRISNLIHGHNIKLHKIPNWMGVCGLYAKKILPKYHTYDKFFQPWMVEYSNINYDVEPDTKLKSDRSLILDLENIISKLRHDYSKFEYMNELRGKDRY